MVTRKSLRSPIDAHELDQAQDEQGGTQQQDVVGGQTGAERRRKKATRYAAYTEGHREEWRMQLEFERGEIFGNGEPEESVEDDFEEIGGSADRLRRTRQLQGQRSLEKEAENQRSPAEHPANPRGRPAAERSRYARGQRNRYRREQDVTSGRPSLPCWDRTWAVPAVVMTSTAGE